MNLRDELIRYDIYPMAFLRGKKKITIEPRQDKFAFDPNNEYYVETLEVSRAEGKRYEGSDGCECYNLKPSDNGTLTLEALFKNEGLYYLSVYQEKGGKMKARFWVYALGEDMRGLYPLRGDLHVHTCRSDGYLVPSYVCAKYRAHGYDFMTVSDHYKYYPSLEARSNYDFADDYSPLTDLNIVVGEEVQMPLNDIHSINFGGEYSINALINEPFRTGNKPRSLYGNEPKQFETADDFCDMIRKRAKDISGSLKLESERLGFACAQWIYEQERQNNGLLIFAHPYWLCDTMQMSQSYLDYFYKEGNFDAFEVLGGENYYMHNGFQTSFYYEMKAKGYDYPVVGSTDSHNPLPEQNRNALICSTIVFSPANTRRDIIDSIKAKRSVAVDTISTEYRLVGDFRLVRYASFLMECWFPLHDRVTKTEGELMADYIAGEKSLESTLKSLGGRIPSMLKKYFEV